MPISLPNSPELSLLASQQDGSQPEESRPEWQQQMQQAVRDPTELCQRLRLPAGFAEGARAGVSGFPVFAPEPYIGRMEAGNPQDPLLLQVLPVHDELVRVDGYVTDPVGDASSRRQAGMIQKYAGRVLLITTGLCAIHCRYCFRRHYPYQDEPRSLAEWEPALQQIEADPTVEEVILSGGDPLTLSDTRLERLVGRLNQIPHLRRLRVHSRLPIVIPARVTDQLLHWLADQRLVPYLVIHANHANELDLEVAASLDRLRRRGVTLLNQSVLLRGVNDSVDALTELSRRLCDHGVIPYYLNQLDRVQGAHHFAVSEADARRIVHALRRNLPGYAVPRLVQEIAGEPSKTVLL